MSIRNNWTGALACATALALTLSLAACDSAVVAPETPLQLVWQVPVTETISQPAVSDGLVFIVDQRAKVIALDEATGTKRWQYDLALVDQSKEPVGADNGYVFVTERGDKGRALALDTATGGLQWEASFGPYRHGEHPIAHEGVVYFEATDAEGKSASLSAVDAATGEPKWEFPVGSFIATSPVVGADLVYIGAYQFTGPTIKTRHIYAIDKATGEQRWTYEPDLDLKGKFALDDSRLYFGADAGVVIARDAATGGPAWTARVDDLLSNSPVVSDGLVLVGNKKGELIALNAEDGSHVWSLAVGSPILTQATVTDGVIYFGTNDGHLYAVDAQSGEEMWKVQSPLRENVLAGDFVPAMATTPEVAGDLLLYFNGESLNALKLK